MWLCGLIGYTVKVDREHVSSRFKTFWLIAPNRLPKKIYNDFKVSWMHILLEMSKAPELVLPSPSDAASSEEIDATFGAASDYLRSKYGCLFVKKNI